MRDGVWGVRYGGERGRQRKGEERDGERRGGGCKKKKEEEKVRDIFDGWKFGKRRMIGSTGGGGHGGGG